MNNKNSFSKTHCDFLQKIMPMYIKFLDFVLLYLATKKA